MFSLLVFGLSSESFGQLSPSVPLSAAEPRSLDTPMSGPPAPSHLFEHARARLRFGVSQHSGSLQDLGPGLTFSGLTPNDVALSLSAYTKGFLGGWLTLQREGLSLYQGDERIAQSALFRASIGPAARFRLGVLRLEGGAGYAFAQLPSFANSRDGALTQGQRHAAFVALRAKLPVTSRLSLEAGGDLPISLSAKDGAGASAKSQGYSAGLGMSFNVARTNRLAWALAADYQWVNDSLTTAANARGEQTIHRFGLSVDLSLVDPLPVIARAEPVAPEYVAPPPAPGPLKLFVKDAITGEPVVSAAASAGAIQSVTDAKGLTQLAGLVAGPTELRVTALGYQPAVEIAQMTDGLDTELVVSLQPEGKKAPATLSGLVRSRRQGTPVEATLEIPNAKVRATSDAKGAFSLQIEAGTYRVSISAPGFRTQRKTIVLREGEQTILNVDLYPTQP